MAYTDLATVKGYLGIATATDDALLTADIARAQKYIESKTGRVFEAATVTKYFREDRIYGQELSLWWEDLLSITTLTNGDATTIPAVTGYRLEPLNVTPYWKIVLLSGYTWYADLDHVITVAGSWGYSATAPADVVEATLELTAYIYRRKDNSAGDQDRPIVSGDGTLLAPSQLPAMVKNVIELYRRRI